MTDSVVAFGFGCPVGYVGESSLKIVDRCLACLGPWTLGGRKNLNRLKGSEPACVQRKRKV
jgi:hypothetical protein